MDERKRTELIPYREACEMFGVDTRRTFQLRAQKFGLTRYKDPANLRSYRFDKREIEEALSTFDVPTDITNQRAAKEKAA